LLTRYKRSALLILVVLLCAAPVAYAGGEARGVARRGSVIQKKRARKPQFSDYSVKEIYKGRVARVRLDSSKARMFRTRLREDSRSGPNFAGHYTVVIWGCGTGCAQMGIVDAKTGRVYFPPVEWMDIPDMEDEQSRGKFFRLDSKLLVITKSNYDMERSYTAYYYLFDKNRFRLLRKAEERLPEQPEQPGT
jgi:hypothetical protein